MQHLTDEQLFEYIDREGSVEEKNNYQQHLATCPACQALYQEYQAIHLQLNSLILEKPSIQFTDKLIASWEAEVVTEAKLVPTYNPMSKSRLWAGLAVVAILLILVLYYVPLWGYWGVDDSSPSSYTWLSIFQRDSVVKGFLLANGLLLLLLVDKLILKPLFERKHKTTIG